MHRSFRRLTPAALLLALAGAANAQTLVGTSAMVAGKSTLFVIDPTTGATTPFMSIVVPANYELRTLAAIPGCKLAGTFYRSDTANNPSQLVIIDPASGTYTVANFGAPLATSYSEGMDWSPRHNALLIGYGPFGNFGTIRLALADTSGAVLATSNALAVGDIDTIASSATLDLLMDLNRTTTPRVYNLSTPFPNPAVTAFASPPSMPSFYDATIHPTTGEILLTNESGTRLRTLVGNTYVDGAPVQTYAVRGLTWCSLPVVITNQPSNTTICPGGVATISVTNVGTEPIDYQWYENGHPRCSPSAAASLPKSGAPRKHNSRFALPPQKNR